MNCNSEADSTLDGNVVFDREFGEHPMTPEIATQIAVTAAIIDRDAENVEIGEGVMAGWTVSESSTALGHVASSPPPPWSVEYA